MPTNGYQIAREHATNEITEINAQLEKLTHRKDLIEKLLELLKLLVPQSGPVDTPATVPEAPAPAVPASDAATHEAPAPEVAAHEAPAHEVHEPEASAHEAPAAELPGNEAAAHEAPTPVAPELQKLHEYAESETQSAAKKTVVPAKENGHSISHEQVAQLAHCFWTERGHVHGHHEQDWFRAAQELCSTAS